MKRLGRWPLVALALPALWVMRKALFGGQVLYYRDIHLVWQAHMEGFVHAVNGGALPLWNPMPGFGQPMLGDPDFMVAYPLTWLNLLMPAWLYYTVFVVLHLFWAALGLFHLVRLWRGSRAAAVTAAGIWTLSGPMLSLISLWHHFASACWIPWVFLAAERAFITRRWRRALVWALVSGVQILAGSADVVAMTLMALAIYAAVYRIRWRRPLQSGNRRVVLLSAVALALAIGLAGVQWGAAIEVVRRSPRWSHAANTRTYWSVHPVNVLDAVVPPPWPGMVMNPVLLMRLFESREPFLASLYLGIATLPLVGAALIGGRPRSRLLAFIVVGAALVSLGRHAPVYAILIRVVPPLQILRYPVKAWIILSFAWSLLCALGVDVWRSHRPLRRWPWVLGVLYPTVLVGALALLGAVFGHWPTPLVTDIVLRPGGTRQEILQALAPASGRFLIAGLMALVALLLGILHLRATTERRRVLASAISLLALADLALVHSSIVDVAPRRLYARPPVVDVLRQNGAGRVYVYDYYSSIRGRSLLNQNGAPELVAQPPGWSEAATYALAQQVHITPSTAGRWNLETGYERDLHGLALPDLTQMVLLMTDLERTPVHKVFLRMAAITHVVALHDSCFLDLLPVAQLPSLYPMPVRVFAVPNPLPRAYAVGGARVAQGPEAFAAMIDSTFDPTREVVLSDGGSGAPPRSAVGAPGPAGTVVIEDRRADRIRVRAQMDREGYLVVVDGYDPAWKTVVDGEKAPLLRANVAFRAVHLAAGTHVVEMRYRPRWALLGFLCTLASAAVLAGLAFWHRA